MKNYLVIAVRSRPSLSILDDGPSYTRIKLFLEESGKSGISILNTTSESGKEKFSLDQILMEIYKMKSENSIDLIFLQKQEAEKHICQFEEIDFFADNLFFFEIILGKLNPVPGFNKIKEPDGNIANPAP